jgi:NifU-like protein
MYSQKVLHRFFEPKHKGIVENYNSRGYCGSVECGDAIELTMNINNKGIIEEAKFRAYGCPGAIASCEAMVELILGKSIEEAQKLKNSDIVEYLDGLPDIKIHCSVMGEEVLNDAINNYLKKSISDEDVIICKCKNITGKQLENFILQEEKYTFDELQSHFGVGQVCGKCEQRIYAILAKIIEVEAGYDISGQ